jgi:hypothetical protein
MARHARVNLSLIMRGIITGGSTYRQIASRCCPVPVPELIGAARQRCRGIVRLFSRDQSHTAVIQLARAAIAG